MKLLQIVIPEDHLCLIRNFNLIRKQKSALSHFTIRILNKNNELRWLNIKGDILDQQFDSEILYTIYDISERKQAEEAINTNLIFLNTLLDTIPNPLFYKNIKCEFIGCNNAMASFLGVTKNDLIEKTVFDIFPEKTAQQIDEINKIQLSGRNSCKYELSVPHADGTVHDVIIDSAIFLNPDDSVGGIVGILTDMFEIKQSKLAIEESENKHKYLLNEIPLGVVAVELNGKILYANQCLIEMIGASNFNDIKNINLFEHKKLAEIGLAAYISKALDENRKISFQGTFITAWNIELCFEAIISPIIGTNKIAKGILIIVIDISKRKKAEDELRASEEKYRILTDNISDVVWFQDSRFNLTYVSPSVKKLLGYTVDEFKNLSFKKLVVPTSFVSLLRLKNKIKHVFNNPKELSQLSGKLIEVECFCKDKTPIWVETKLDFYRNYTGNVIGFQGVSRDVTIRKESINKLHQAKEKAEKADKFKSIFVANMSHELRTPLNAILNFTTFLSEEQCTEQQKKEYLEYIRSGCESLQHLINEMLDTAKIDEGQIKITNTTFDLNKIMDELCTYYKTAVKSAQKNVQIKLTKPNGNHEIVMYSDSIRIKQILSNLINNAVKFTDSGYVEFGYDIIKNAQGNENEIFLFVRDTGIGISVDKIQKIFERYYQVNEEDKRNITGSGIGLSITKSLVELLGGSIIAKSQPDKGTEFNIVIPYKKLETQNQNEVKMERALEDYNWTNKLILIAEDSPMNFLILQKAIERNKGKYIWAQNGEIAIELFKQNPDINLVLMDMQMPKIDGYECTKILKSINPLVPIIAQTAFALDGEKERSFNAGCDDYITKPIDKNEFNKKINHHLFK